MIRPLRQLRSTERLLSCRVPLASPTDDDHREDDETDHEVEYAGDPDADQFGDAEEIRNDEEDEHEALPSLIRSSRAWMADSSIPDWHGKQT